MPLPDCLLGLGPRAAFCNKVAKFGARARSPLSSGRGSEPGRGLRLYVQSLEGGKPRPITPEGITVPADPAGVERISNVLVAPDGKSYAYCYARLLSDLFVVEGLK